MPPARDHVPSLCARYSHLSPVVTQENADTDHTRTGEPPKLAEHRPAYLQPQRSAELLIRPGLAGSCLAASLPFAPPFWSFRSAVALQTTSQSLHDHLYMRCSCSCGVCRLGPPPVLRAWRHDLSRAVLCKARESGASFVVCVRAHPAVACHKLYDHPDKCPTPA